MRQSAKKQFICIAGKNNIAVDVLKYLLKKKDVYDLGIVCNNTETGRDSFQKSLRCFARENGVKEYDLEEIYNIENLVFLSMEFDRLIRPERFKNARLYNIHFSLLPQYKGMYTSAIPILNGETMSGVTLHRIDEGIDTGEIIDQESFSIQGLGCREVYVDYIKYGIKVVLRNIEAILAGVEISYPQKAAGATYYSKSTLNYRNIVVDLNQTAEGIGRQIRAFHFREYQLAKVNEKYIIDYKFTNIKSIQKPGTILLDFDNGCMVSTIDYNIILYYDRLHELFDCCEKGDLKKAQVICAVRKHINESNENGQTPLMVSVYHSQGDIAKFLLLCGADIYAVDNYGKSVWDYVNAGCQKSGDNTLVSLFALLLR